MVIEHGRMIQTSTEVKNKYKKQGVVLPARQQKQYERGSELDQRAAIFREIEEKRKAAKKKRDERQAREEQARQQCGIGLATQMIGYSHTQAQLKNGMEAFLGIKKRRDEAQRRKDMEINKKCEEIEMVLDKELWDDEDDHGEDKIALDITKAPCYLGAESYDDIDDDSLLQAHDLVMSDPIEEPPTFVQPTLDSALSIAPIPPSCTTTKNEPNITDVHGPINKVIEETLSKLPEQLIELLSQDISMKHPDWDPSPGLLHKLNPIGLPPHRLRIKIGCIVTVLRDLNHSSQLSKSQHLQVLRVDNNRLECLILDGQLKGTNTILTRVPFLAKYRNQDQYPFQRTQFPVRVSIGYTSATLPSDPPRSGFKQPAVLNRTPVPRVDKTLSRDVDAIRQSNRTTGFKTPNPPISKPRISTLEACVLRAKPTASSLVQLLDGWDDFLDSGTQIARELSEESTKPVSDSLGISIVNQSLNAGLIPHISTQDLSLFSNDLEDDSDPVEPLAGSKISGLDSTKNQSELKVRKTAIGGIDLSNLRPSQKPLSVSDRPGLKRKTFASFVLPSKRRCTPALPPVLPKSLKESMKPCIVDEDFMMSTQDVASFFEDDEVDH